jgi:hypothetical protein
MTSLAFDSFDNDMLEQIDDRYWDDIAPPSDGTDPVNPSVYPDGSGGFVDGDNNPVKENGTPIAPADPGDNRDAGGGFNPGKGGTGTPNAAITDAFNKLFGSSFTGKQLAGLFGVAGGGIAGLLGANKPSVVKGTMGYQGKIPQYTANRNMATAPPTSVDGKPYRPGQGGVNYGGDVTYTPKGTVGASKNVSLPADGGQSKDDSIGHFGIDEYGRQSGNPDFGKPSTTLPKMSDGPGYTPAMSFHDMAMPFKSSQPSAGGIPGVPDYMVAAETPDVTSRGMTMEYTPADRARDEAMRSRSPTYDASEAERMQQITGAAQGGLMGLAKGRYLQGNTDGMADKLRTSIDGKQPAALSHGEFVIPADVVSHLGNGNSDAGAKKLYSMMDKIREARTGSKKQGKQINPDKFMPGGLAQLAQGGTVQRFAEGGVPSGTLGTEQTLASWTGDYVPNMLAKGEALANAPYQQYGGPLTAGPSALQTQAFGAAGNLSVPASVGTAADTAGGIAAKAQNMNYSPTQATNQFTAPGAYQNTNFTSGTFGNEQAQQYMNPYLQQSLNPQLAEARRQSDITAQQNNAKMTQAGAFGGGRQALLTAENQRNLGTNMANITGQGYNTAFTNAMGQFNQDQNRNLQAQQASEQSKQFGAGQGMTSAQNAAQYGQAAQQANIGQQQFGANLGLQGLQLANQAAQNQGNLGISSGQLGLANLNAQANLGAQERGIESEGIAADQAAFSAARDNPYKMLQFQQSLLDGLPISAQNYQTTGTSGLTDVAGGMTTVDKALDTLGLGSGTTGVKK